MPTNKEAEKAVESLRHAINQAVEKWLFENRVQPRPTNTLSPTTQRRIREVLNALTIPEHDWAKRISDLSSAIAAGQSLDDLSGVNLNDVMIAAVDELQQRWLRAQASQEAARRK